MKLFQLLLFLLSTHSLTAQITIDIHPNFKHSVGGIDNFDRSVFIKAHADTDGPDWDGRNFQDFRDLRDTFLNKMDVYLGRNTGGVSWHFRNVKEDPNRLGFADPVDLANRGASSRNTYANQPFLKAYEKRNQLVIGAQQRPFYPDGTPTAKGWIPAGGEAVGEYLGRYVNEFYGQNGQPKPAYVEIMNEPLYEFVTVGDRTPEEVFQFHNEVADAYRAQDPGVPIGGYVAAFPNFEERNFQRWYERMKLFIDMSGGKMDFFSIHLYDMNAFWQGGFDLRRGSNVEATLDMMEHYSQLSFGEIKPLVVSEIGGRSLREEFDAWTPLRDWSFLKSTTPLTMSLMDRPQHILSSMPFIITKAEWGRQADGDPYPWRLMRQAFEGEGEEGSWWVFTDMVKFYQLWSDVRGTRIAIESTDPDIQSNAFVDGDKLYVVLNNLYFSDQVIYSNIIEQSGNTIQNIRVKHLYLNAVGDAPVLEETNHTALDSITIGHDAGMVLEYTFEQAININQTSDETKYYATTYLTPIVANAIHTFHINKVQKGEQGTALLRLGMGRPHETSLQPTVKINGYEIEVPANYMGYDQRGRNSWFGVIEIPVPYYYLQTNNEVTVQFPDIGGHISSMALRVFNQSATLLPSDAIAVSSLDLQPAFKQLEPDQTYSFIPSVTPINATNPIVTWSSNNPSIATVDEIGQVTAIALGQATIMASINDGALIAQSNIEVLEVAAPVEVTNIQITPKDMLLGPTQVVQMQATISPTDATNKAVLWTSTDPSIAAIDENGLLTAGLPGEVQIIGTTEDGTLSDTSTITVEAQFPTFIRCNFLPTTLESDTLIDISIDFSAAIPMEVVLKLVDANGVVVSEGKTLTTTGFGTETITLQSSTFPTSSTGYQLEATIQFADEETIIIFDECVKENVTIRGMTTNIVPIELASISLYPNPTNGILFAEFPNSEKEVQVSIYDVNGVLLQQSTTTQKRIALEVGYLASGIYIVKIANKQGHVLKRFIVR